jgi:hypothetical protein
MQWTDRPDARVKSGGALDRLDHVVAFPFPASCAVRFPEKAIVVIRRATAGYYHYRCDKPPTTGQEETAPHSPRPLPDAPIAVVYSMVCLG